MLVVLPFPRVSVPEIEAVPPTSRAALVVVTPIATLPVPFGFRRILPVVS